LSTVGAGNVSVTGPNGGPYTIVLAPALNQPLSFNGGSLSNPTNGFISPAQAFDILFTPAGPLAPNATTQPVLYLWVRDTRDDIPANAAMFGPHQRLVAIYPRTGSFSSYSVDTTPGWSVVLSSPTAPTGGTFSLTYGGSSTTQSFNATAAAVQAGLAGLPGVGAGNVVVTGAAGGPYTVAFAPFLTGTLTGNFGTLVGGSMNGSVTKVYAHPFNFGNF